MEGPTLKQMLEMGEFCELQTVEEAYNNMTLHYDAFFSIEHYAEQLHSLQSEMKRAGLLQHINGNRWVIKDISIEEAKSKL